MGQFRIFEPTREHQLGKKLVIGCGYLGERVARAWAHQGHHVFATTRREERAQELKALGIEPIVCEVTHVPSETKMPTVETVLHCVGLDRTSGQSMQEVYVQGLQNVLRVLPKPTRFLYVSSTSLYAQENGEAVDEEAPTEPTEGTGVIVLQAENVLREALPEAIVLRFAGIYGPGRVLRAKAIQAGEPLTGNPERWVNLIHVDDGVQVVLAAEARGRSGRIYNVSDGHPVTRKDLFELTAEILNAPPLTVKEERSGRERSGNRQIVNQRTLEELQVELGYPNYRVGLRHATNPRTVS